MGLALKCEECQCEHNIQIGTSPFFPNLKLKLCDSCQFDKFADRYNVIPYEIEDKIYSISENGNES